MKENRQQKILEIIKREEVYTQEGLLQKLKEEGFEVTQATVSRDIKKLNLVKKLTPEGKYIYSSQEAEETEKHHGKFRSMFAETVIGVDHAINIVVLKCHVGMANAACASFDLMSWDGVVGTIAGDDTVFVLMRTEQQAMEFQKEMEAMIGR